jgi:3-keto-5-aminohexanoate cleavage enzyme
MTSPAIVTVAITGSVPRKEHNPAVPITSAEQIESTQEAFEAGAAIVHIHVRDQHQNPSSDPESFARVQEGVRKYCPGMIVQFSTGGRGRKADERGAALRLRPDMASLTTGSVNFAAMIYENAPELIEALARQMLELGIKPEVEVFDLSMLYNARDLVDRGLLKPPIHVQFVLGNRNALPAWERTLDLLIGELREVLPDATWAALGVSRYQLIVNEWVLARGGHVRTGLEDNLYKSYKMLASSNAELVRMAVDLCGKYDRRPARPAEAREILRLPSVVPGSIPSGWSS